MDANDSTDTTNATVHVISLSSKTETRHFLVPKGAQNLAPDAAGNLWIVFNATGVAVRQAVQQPGEIAPVL